MIAGPLLALDSSTTIGSAAVGDVDGVRAEIVRNVAGGHSSALLPAAEAAMESAGLRPKDLAGVVVAGGPGSFTGLRIAAATAKGMVRALGVPLYAYSGLLATAATAWSASGPICALFDARRRDLFGACYRFGPAIGEVEVLMEPAALSLDDLITRWRGREVPLFVGEGARIHREELEGELGASVGPAHLTQPRASALIWLAYSTPGSGRVEDPARWQPDYLRASGAERIAAQRRGEVS